MQCVVRHGEDFVFATHEDGVELGDRYAARTVDGPGGTVTLPAGTIVRVPWDFRFAVDDAGRLKDPRRWAAEGQPLAK
jgi:hypothetical protein